MPKQFTFVMEQTLGHIPFAQNIKPAFDNDNTVEVNWQRVLFEPQSRIERLPLVNNNWSIRGSLQARRLVQAVRKEAGGWSDLYLFHTQVIALLSAGWLPSNIPVVISLDATPINYDRVGQAYGHTAGNAQLEKFKFMLNKRAFNRATYLVAWSEWARQSLIQDYKVNPAKVEVVMPGINLSLWQSDQSQPVVNKESQAEKLKLLFVGGNFERKGGRLLYETFRRSLSDKYELHLVTQGKVEPADGVFVWSNLKPNSPEIQNLFRQADVFVLPTEGDCLPVAIGEALAAGLPVVSTSVGAIKEAVVPGENGFVISPGDGEALAQSLITLAHEPELRRKMGWAGRRRAEASFDAAKNGRRILEICKTLADGRAIRPEKEPNLVPVTAKPAKI